MNNPHPPAIFLMGPTASGKTDLSFALVEQLNCEIISVDSALIYQQMNIGTAKPTPDTLAKIPHHLIDILDPAESYSAAQFRADALVLMQRITQAGKIPLLVGGTMLYFKALEQGLSTLPHANQTLRNQLEQERQQIGALRQHQRLQQVDAITAKRLHPNDSQRVQRALEVYELTNKPLAQHYLEQQNYQLPFQCHKIILSPAQRNTLHQRIEQRFMQMLKLGLIEEVRRLHARTDLNLKKPAMRAVGYRQVWQYLDQLHDYQQMIDTSISASRQLAKRQLTWLRSTPNAVWFDSTHCKLVPNVLSFLDKL